MHCAHARSTRNNTSVNTREPIERWRSWPKKQKALVMANRAVRLEHAVRFIISPHRGSTAVGARCRTCASYPSALGAIGWVFFMTMLGYNLGQVPFVRLHCR